MNTSTTIALSVGVVLIAGAFLFSSGSARVSPQADTVGAVSNVAMVGDTQVITIDVKGGYAPRQTVAKAGVPTILKMNTSGTFDCSSAVRIPSRGVVKNLPPSGSTEIALGTPAVGPLQGMCVMGMYSFQIDFL